MLVEESRIFQVTTFRTVQLHRSELDQNQVLLDVVIIADEADRQLTETVRGFMTAQQAAASQSSGSANSAMRKVSKEKSPGD
jgi:hypothetical protein